MARQKKIAVKLSEQEAIFAVAALSEFIARHDKMLAGVDDWKASRETIAALARRIDLAALDAGMFNAFTATAEQVIYDTV